MKVVFENMTVTSHIDGHEWTRVIRCGWLDHKWVLRSFLPDNAMVDQTYEISDNALSFKHPF